MLFTVLNFQLYTVLRPVLKDDEIQWFLKCVKQKSRPFRELQMTTVVWDREKKQGKERLASGSASEHIIKGISLTLVRETLLSFNLFIAFNLERTFYFLNE